MPQIHDSTTAHAQPDCDDPHPCAAARTPAEATETEIALRRSEARFRHVVETAPSALIMSDRMGKITLVNARAEALFGYTRDELIGQQIELLVPDAIREAHAQQRRAYFAAPVALALSDRDNLQGRHKDGRLIPLEIGLNPVGMEDGLQVLAAIVDVSRRKTAEEALKREAAELERRNRELDEFSYVASHDLQEPLRKLIGFSNLLQEDLGHDLPAQAAKDLDVIKRSAIRMRTLVQNLLALSRTGKSEMKRTAVPLARCVDAAMDALSEQITARGATITCDPLPTLIVDETLITQVYQNLLSNALKFAAPGRKPVIHLTAEDSQDGVILSVLDNGVGISREYAEKVFTPFLRCHTRPQAEGAGVGLAICRTAVERHGGRIWVVPQRTHGTQFKFMLPTAEATACSPSTPNRPPSPA